MGVHTDNERLREKIERYARMSGMPPEQALEQLLEKTLEEGQGPEAEPSTSFPDLEALLDEVLTMVPEEHRRTREDALERMRKGWKILKRIDSYPRLPQDHPRSEPEWDDVGLPK